MSVTGQVTFWSDTPVFCVFCDGSVLPPHFYAQPITKSFSDRVHHEVTWISPGVNSKINTNKRINTRILMIPMLLVSCGHPDDLGCAHKNCYRLLSR